MLAEGFNAAMRVRNAVWSPPFVMYYLTFLWPKVRGRLLAAGFDDVEMVRGAFEAPFENVLLVTATKRLEAPSALGFSVRLSSRLEPK